MVPKRCLICCGESFSIKTGTPEANSTFFPSTENLNCQQEGKDNGDTELQILFLLRKLLEIPESTCCLLREHFGNASVWIECCDSCLDLVEKCKAALEQAELFQKQYEELRSNIKTTMLKSPKKPFSAESKCEAIVRSILITQEIETFIINTTVTGTDKEIIPDENVNYNPITPVRSQGKQVLIGPITPVLLESINNTVKSEQEISISFNENVDMDCNLESSDFGNNIQFGNTFACEQKNCETIPLDNISQSATHNLEQLIVPPKPNERSRGSKSSRNTTEKPIVSRKGDKDDAEKKYECHVCLQLFELPQELRNHLRSHSNTETGKNTVTKRKGNLRKQASKHTAEKKFKCDICGKSFAKFWNLKTHRRIHSAETPFVCDICGKGYTAARSLDVHYKVHSGEKPFECDVCGKAFMTKSNLKAHQTKHSQKKPFKCDICDTSFKHKKSLTKHGKKHDDEKTS